MAKDFGERNSTSLYSMVSIYLLHFTLEANIFTKLPGGSKFWHVDSACVSCQSSERFLALAKTTTYIRS